MSRFEKIEKLLYSYEDWNTVARGKTPHYYFEIKKDNQSFFYFGANHSRDIHNSQYKKLKLYWKRFLEETKGENAVVLVEGGVRKIYKNEELAVKGDSEAGFITLLASKVGIPTFSPEPDPLDERDYILKKFSEDELNYYYFSRLANAWNMALEPKASFEEYIGRYSERKSKIKNWLDFGFPLKEMKEIHKKIIKNNFDKNNKELFALLINPTKKENPIRQVVIANSTYRNICVVQEVEKLWNKGKNIFIVYGGAHPILQEPALRELLK
jgi:hypothetical protein